MYLQEEGSSQWEHGSIGMAEMDDWLKQRGYIFDIQRKKASEDLIQLHLQAARI